MAVTLGSTSLIKANLIVVQGITFRCRFDYTVDGEPVDMTGWEAYMDIYSGDEKMYDLDHCVIPGSDGSVQVHMTPEDTASIEVGTSYVYDIVLKDVLGETVRLAEGSVKVSRKYSDAG